MSALEHVGRLLCITAIIGVGAAVAGCAAATPGPAIRAAAAGTARCEQVEFDREQLAFRCGDATYELLRAPVRSERLFNIVSREAYTRRYYRVRLGRRAYAYKAVQMMDERYPRKVVLETGQGFRRVLLDLHGNVIAADRAADLGQ